MNKLSIYILFILIFLGLSKSISISKKGTDYIEDKNALEKHIHGNMVSLILLDYFETGIFIKSYYHKYKIISDYKPPHFFTVRVSQDFKKQNERNIGMSIFRRNSKNETFTTPLPPGFLFIGNPSYGTWKNNNSQIKNWKFYRSYRHLIKELGLNFFPITSSFYELANHHLKNKKAFYGAQNEFGVGGSVTKKNFIEHFNKKIKNKITIKDFILKMFKIKSKWKNR